jgi:hypothetical protein
VYCKPEPQDGQKALHYLGRYAHRVIITNRRIASIRHGRVGFGYKNSRAETWKTTRHAGHRLVSLSKDFFVRRRKKLSHSDSFIANRRQKH